MCSFLKYDVKRLTKELRDEVDRLTPQKNGTIGALQASDLNLTAWARSLQHQYISRYIIILGNCNACNKTMYLFMSFD